MTIQRPKVVRTCCMVYLFRFEMCFAPQVRALFQQLNFQKYSRMMCFYHFGLQICFAPRSFALCTASKSDPTMRCFVRFGFGMYFRAPQAHALFRHHNIHKRVLCIFDFKMCFGPQRQAIFDISHPTRWLRTRPDGSAPAAFASVLFDPAQPQIQSIGKIQSFATFLPFCLPRSSFYTDPFSSHSLSSPIAHCCCICP